MTYEYLERELHYSHLTSIGIKWINCNGETVLRHAVRSNEPLTDEKRKILQDMLWEATFKYINLNKDKVRWRWYIFHTWMVFLERCFHRPRRFIKRCLRWATFWLEGVVDE